MFNNIGNKIKNFAIAVFIIGIIGSVVGAIVLFLTVGAIGLVLLLGGPLFFWLGSFFTYGYGELIERAASIDEKLGKGNVSKAQQAEYDARRQELEKLREKGLITEEEFANAIQKGKNTFTNN